MFRRVTQQDRPALAIGDEEAAHRRVGDAHLLGDDVALQERALMAAILFRPGHAEPAALADTPRELAGVGILALGLERVEGTGRDFISEKRAHLLAQRLAFGWQADRIKTERGHATILFVWVSARGNE